MAQQEQYEKYYVPEQSIWPIVGAVALFLIAVGAGNFTIEVSKGKEGFGGWILLAGIVMLIVMVTGWFRNQIHESMSGLYSAQLGRSYRQGMAWFIFSEVMFFAAFFGALWYARVITMPWLGDLDHKALLWPNFSAVWPNTGPAEIVRATLESICYQTNDLFEAMKEDGVQTSISFNSSSNRVYTLLGKTNLCNAVWDELLGPRAGAGGVVPATRVERCGGLPSADLGPRST